MAETYIVVDHEGFASGDDGGEPQSFKTLAAARKRATGMAKLVPGETIRVYQAIEECVAPVQPVVTKRLA